MNERIATPAAWVTTLSFLILLLVLLLAPGPANAQNLLLWNRFESEDNVVHSDYGPGFTLTSYLYADWEEARIEPAVFGNGLYVNHDTNEGWNNDGGNFFALDLWETGLSPERGTIEFWFRFKYPCSTFNHAHFFVAADELTGHMPGPLPEVNHALVGGWSGWNFPDRKNYFMIIGAPPLSIWAFTPARSAGPGGSLEFDVDTEHHFAWVWDVDGIEGTADTMRIYVNGNLEGAVSGSWQQPLPFRRYLYLGSTPNYGNWDHEYNAIQGVTDNLKIWDYAKTDFSDRFVENAFPTFLGASRLWIGLKNSDDQGTRFDLRVEAYKNDALVGSGLTRCIAGVARNPSKALEAPVSFDPLSPVTYAPGDVLSFKVLTRIGTDTDDTKCFGHNNAVGLRLYYDATQRPSGFEAEFSPDPLADLYLHASGSADFLSGTAPNAATAIFKDSPPVNFSAGNPWREVGSWTMTMP